MRRAQVAAISAGAAVGVVVALVLATGLGDDESDARRPAAATTTPARAGPCDDLLPAAMADAMGGPATVTPEGPEHCTVARDGTLLTARVDQLATDATPATLDAIDRSSGAGPDDLRPWPEEELPDVADGARWLTDPDAGGGAGELYALSGGRLVRITISAPPGYRRAPRTIATDLARVVLTGL